MGQVISSFLRFFGVEVMLYGDGADTRSLISHEQGPSHCINIYPNDGTKSEHESVPLSPPILFPSSDSRPLEKPLTDIPCSESCLDAVTHDHGNLRSSVADKSNMLCLDQETGTIYVEEIRDVVMIEEDPTGQALVEQAFGSEAGQMTKSDFVNGSNIKGAICKEIVLEERSIGPYTSSQKMLLVGEGDFSFSASLAAAFGSAVNMVATSLDSREFLSNNYRHAIRNISQLTERGATVLHGVDCTKMKDLFSSMRFDRVIYNFPHAGFCGRDEPRESQLHRHRTLVRLFLASAKKLAKNKGGEIHITHKSQGFFLEWDLKSLALDEGLLLLEKVPFSHKDYPGYHTMCGFGGNNFFYCYPCKTYKFVHPHTL